MDERPRYGDPDFNGGQHMGIHEGDAMRLVLDDAEERRLQPDSGDGPDLTAAPPPGTVGAPSAEGEESRPEA